MAHYWPAVLHHGGRLILSMHAHRDHEKPRPPSVHPAGHDVRGASTVEVKDVRTSTLLRGPFRLAGAWGMDRVWRGPPRPTAYQGGSAGGHQGVRRPDSAEMNDFDPVDRGRRPDRAKFHLREQHRDLGRPCPRPACSRRAWWRGSSKRAWSGE